MNNMDREVYSLYRLILKEEMMFGRTENGVIVEFVPDDMFNEMYKPVKELFIKEIADFLERYVI